jgi:hypothetical protein
MIQLSPFIIKLITASIVIIGYVSYVLYFNLRTNKDKEDKTETFPPFESKCPDYWEVVGKDLCKNVNKLGVCLTGTDDVMDFDIPVFKGPKGKFYKCSWAQKCKVPWEGISNLCA